MRAEMPVSLTLGCAWRAVNAHLLSPLVRDGDKSYLARLLLPGVTLQDPPAP